MTPTHVLPARVTLADAEALLAEIQAGGARPVLEAGAVEELPAAYVLVLTSLLRAEAERGAKVAVIAPSAAFVDAFADLGLFQDLMKMEFCQ